jgi:uncharacterized membrane protein YphA (DoxX/SURF4 family)
MFETFWPWMHVVGRVLFAVSLMILSLGHFTQTASMAGYAASKRVPAPQAAVITSGAMVWIGAIFIALGWHRFIGAGLVVLFLVPVSFMIHNYWAISDPMARMMDRINFWKNIGMAGAALFIAFYSGAPWPFSWGG